MNMNREKTLKFLWIYIQKFVISVIFVLATSFIQTHCFAQVISGTIEFEERTRDYKLFLPTDYEKLDSLPLVINLHGSYTGERGERQMNSSRMNTVADTAGFIVVYPSGIYENGSAGGWYTNLADPMNNVGFIDALLDTLNDLYKINNDQIYSCGFSAGGNMSCTLAYALPHRITAIANVGGSIDTDILRSIELERPMPFLSIHGTLDSYGSAEMTIKFWKDENICSEPDTIKNDNGSFEKITYFNQGTGCEVRQFKVFNGTHVWLNRENMISSLEIWKFFKQYKLSELSFLNHDVTPRSLIYDFKTLPRYINLKPVVLMQNGGLNDESTIPATFEIDSSGTIVYESSQVFNEMKSMEKKDLIFDKPHTLIADQYELICKSLLSEDENIENDRMNHKITMTNSIDDFESGDTKRWISDYGWGTRRSAKDANTGDFVLYSRKDRNYRDTDTTTITFFSSFNLSSLETAFISYSTKHEFYEGDVGFVEVSVDNGQTWQQMGEPLAGNIEEHKLVEIPLEAYVQQDMNELMIRFKIINNPDNGFPIWFIDDVMLHPNETSGIAVKSELSSILNDQFVLNGNYPNPFNPSTVIKYSNSHQQHLSITIMNILGQKVVTLLDKQQSPGEYSITWNGYNASGYVVNSGIYYCQIRTSNNVYTSKMMLLK